MRPPYPARVLIVAVVLIALAVVVAGVGAAGLTGRLPRNRWVGIRTAESVRDDDAFQLANRVAGPTMLAGAALLVIAGFAALTLDGVFAIAAVVVAVAAAMITAGVGGSLGSRAAAALEPAGGCGHACTSCSRPDRPLRYPRQADSS